MSCFAFAVQLLCESSEGQIGKPFLQCTGCEARTPLDTETYEDLCDFPEELADYCVAGCRMLAASEVEDDDPSVVAGHIALTRQAVERRVYELRAAGIGFFILSPQELSILVLPNGILLDGEIVRADGIDGAREICDHLNEQVIDDGEVGVGDDGWIHYWGQLLCDPALIDGTVIALAVEAFEIAAEIVHEATAPPREPEDLEAR